MSNRTVRNVRRAAAVLGVALLAVAAAPVRGAEGTVSVTKVNGRPVVDSTANPGKAGMLRIEGMSTAPTLFVDAGDSVAVLFGAKVPVRATAGLGAPPYSYSWSFAGASDRFADAGAASTIFDTTDLAGPAALNVSVTDDVGAVATDSVLIFIRTEDQVTVLDKTHQRGPEANLISDEEGDRHPFAVPAGTERLDLELDWAVSYDLVAVRLRGYDLLVDDPSDREDGNTSGAGFEQPERIVIEDPAAGEWAAIVRASVTAPDEYRVTAVATVSQPDPVPVLATGAPYRFQLDDPQVVSASVTGGTAPFDVAWDLDFNGIFESRGTEVTTNFGLGNHFVTVKLTDANGYEKREVVPVLVSAETPQASPFVVVGVSDTGINLYHDDFGAALYPDEGVKELTGDFTRHPSTYLPGFPADAEALPITLGQPFAPGRLHPAEDAELFTTEKIVKGKLFWVPGTKIVGVLDASDTAAINAEPDATPILDDDGHGTASASVAVGNIYGFCPTCLLAFGEGFAATDHMYGFDWVDLASNSFGTLANIGFAGLLPPDFPREQAEKGQIALYAAGNGNENAFLTPEQTYTSDSLGPDWVIRVGAVERGSRQPFIGTGKPVDVSSFGLGDIPAAAANSPDGTTRHSGTSAATPYTAGVFGSVLRGVRGAVGDGATGPKNDDGESGVIAKGAPVAGSPYLADGKLTRAELVEVVFKTAEHDTEGITLQVPPTVPFNDLQYVFEGYGIVEPASGARALDVLLDGAPLPPRPDEDDFFLADTFVREVLWGPWNGGGENSAQPDSTSVASAANPFTGTTLADVTTFDAAFELLAARMGPFAPGATLTAASPSGDEAGSDDGLAVTIEVPAPGTIVDADVEPSITVAGKSTFTFGPRSSLPTRFFPRRDPAVACNQNPDRWLGREDGPDAICVMAGQSAGAVPVVNEIIATGETFPVRAGDLPITLDGTLPVEGVVYVQGEISPSPVHAIEVSLRSGDAVLGSAVVSGSVLTGAEGTPFPFSFTIDPDFAGEPLGALELRLQHVVSTGLAEFELDNPASFIDLPLVRDAGYPDGARIEIAVDDPDFDAPLVADFTDTAGGWAAEVAAAELPSGQHTISARAVAEGVTSAVASTSVIISRDPPPLSVEVQIVPAGDPWSDTGWVTASDRSRRGDYSTWLVMLKRDDLAAGEYELRSRLRKGGVTGGTGAPVRLFLE